jgi:hypothetical protein
MIRRMLTVRRLAMIRRMLTVRRLAPIAALALAAGGAVAQASGGAATTPRPAPAAVAAVPAAPAVVVQAAPAVVVQAAPAVVVQAAPPVVAIAARGTRVAAPVASVPGVITTAAPVVPAPGPPRLACAPSKASPSNAPPSDALKDAFGILSRDRSDEDTLPAAALTALKRSGLAPVEPQSARLLRADGAARAWVVPVPDVDATSVLRCLKGAVPREGLAVVSVGGAAAGGGGALRDLLRGIAPASVDSCAGAAHDMLGVSGIVPDDVEAVFVTAADGTATRADVHDNGYTFVLPRMRRLESRYLVWTAKDGTPHVQPLAILPFGPSNTVCGRQTAAVRLSPDAGNLACGPFGTVPVLRLRSLIVTVPKRASGRSRAAARARSRARSRARTRARRAPARRKAPLRLPVAGPLAVCAPSALATAVQINPKTGRFLAPVPPRVKAPTATVPARPKPPTATVPATPKPPTATLPAKPKPRTTP